MLHLLKYGGTSELAVRLRAILEKLKGSLQPRLVEDWILAIGHEELRRLGNKSGKIIEGVRIYEKYPHEHGMVVMQRWFMRKELLDRLSTQNEAK